VINRQRLLLIASISISITALVLLATGLPRIDLRPGTIFISESTPEPDEAAPEEIIPTDEDRGDSQPNRLILLLLLVPIVLFVLILIFIPNARKRVLRNIVVMIFWAALLYYVYTRQSTEPTDLDFTSSDTLTNDLPNISQTPLPPVSSDSPSWLVYLIGFSVILLILGVVYFYYQRSRTEEGDLGLLVEEAQSTLEEIQSGVDLRNAILRCYYEMSSIVQRERGIQRKSWMTPREFENRLVNSGLPKGPVKTLTHLFEFVRYGAVEPNEDQENQAIECLDAIVQSGGKTS
jgi:hypothetical protein